MRITSALNQEKKLCVKRIFLKDYLLFSEYRKYGLIEFPGNLLIQVRADSSPMSIAFSTFE